jgi:hypothetical protein
MPDAAQANTPTGELASRITEALCTANLIPPTKRDELLAKLNSGRITAQDWRVLIELGLPRQHGEQTNAAAR